MSDVTRFFHRLALASHLSLLAWVCIWQFVLTEGRLTSDAFIFMLWVVPLLLPLPGIIKGNPYTHAWTNFITMFYFLHSLTALYTEQGEWLYALIELMLTTGMFIGCCFYARMRGRELGLKLKKLSELP